MKSKGFTLVELLAVLVLISVIAIIAIPSIINYINQSQGEIDSATEKLIFSGAQLYVDQNKNDFKVPQKQYCVTLQQIVDEKYLSDSIFDGVSGNKLDLNTFVKVTNYYNVDKKRNDYKYDISNECVEQEYTCIPTTKDTVTVGNVPNGQYNPGDEYICQVSNDEFYRFFVLKKQDDSNVKLIMNKNIGERITWCEMGEHGIVTMPCEANMPKKYLASQTSEWTKITNSGGKIELPSGQEIADILGDTEWTVDADVSEINGYEWININLSEEDPNVPYGYWTSTATANSKIAWLVCDFALLGSISTSKMAGVRPVITINVSEIAN